MYQRLIDAPSAGGDAAGTGRAWDAAPDLERFLASFYRYFEVKGLRGILAIHVAHLVCLAFTIGFSFLLLFLVNWHALLSCDSEESCKAMPLYHPRPFQDMGFGRFWVLVCTLLFLVYWIFNAVACWHDIGYASEMNHYYKEKLGIVSDESLETMLWSEVVSRLVQQQKVSPFCIVQDELSALEMTNIIMREDNFMIALTNHHAFTSKLPSWIPPRLVYTKAVFWNLRNAIFRSAGAAAFDSALDHRSRIREDFLDHPEALAKRLRMLGLLNIVLVLPVLVFVGIYFFMRHAEEFRSQRSSPFRRQWTDYAHWTFREFNELPHQFKVRMHRAEAAAEAYIRATRPSSPVLESFLRCVKFVAGSILAALLVVALWDDSPLLFVKIQDKNLLWYLAVFGFVFAVADSAGEDSGSASFSGAAARSGGAHHLAPSAPLRMYTALLRMVSSTHFLPPRWRSPAPLSSLAGACNGLLRSRLCNHFRKVRQDLLGDFLVHRIQALFEELLGVLLSPLLLFVYLPEAAPDIVEVMRRARHSSPCLGDWCSYGCLDPETNGSEFYGCRAVCFGGGASSTGEVHQASESVQRFREEQLVSNGGKLEKSVLTFLLNHQLLWSPGQEDENCRNEFSEPQLARRDLGLRGHGVRRVGYSPPPLTSATGSQPVHIPLRDLRPTAPFEREEAGDHQEDLEPLEWHAEGPPAAPAEDSSSAAEPSGSASAGPGSSSSSRSICGGGKEVGGGSLSRYADRPPPGPESEEDLAARIWGYPAAALRLLRELEEFQKQELCSSESGGGSGENYALLPDDIVRLLPTSRPAGMASAANAVQAAAADLEEGKGQDSVDGAHFFWLEALYDFNSGRHAAARAAAPAAAAAADSARWSFFSRQPLAQHLDSQQDISC